MNASKLFLGLFALASSVNAIASTEVGNGGDVVTCWNSTKTTRTAELLDFYEARGMYGLPTVLDPGASVESNLQKLLETFAKTEPDRAEKYNAWARSFFREASVIPNVELTDIDDSKHLVFPVGCEVKQIAIQKEVRYSFDKRYVISKDLWDLLDNANRAGLIFHELLYRDAIENQGLKNGSRALRLVNGLVAADQFHLVSPDERVKIWTEFGFKDIHLSGIRMRTDSLKWGNENGQVYLAEFKPAKEQFMEIPFGNIQLAEGVPVSLYSSGAIKRIEDPRSVDPNLRGYRTLNYKGQAIKFWREIEFNESGLLKYAVLNELTVQAKLHGTMQCIHEVALYEDGFLKTCQAKTDLTAQFHSDRYDLHVRIKPEEKYSPSIKVGFDENGYLSQIWHGYGSTIVVSGTYPIQGVSREVSAFTAYASSESYWPYAKTLRIDAELKHPEKFTVAGKTVSFAAGKIALENDAVVLGTLTEPTILPANAHVVPQGKSELKVSPYAACGLFRGKSRPVPTFFNRDGKVTQGVSAELVTLKENISYAKEVVVGAGEVFLTDTYYVWANGSKITWKDPERVEDFCD